MSDASFFTGEEGFAAYGSQEIGEHSMSKGVSYWSGRTFVGHDTNISVKSEYHRGDYEYFRPGETIPTDIRGIIQICMEAYEKVGIVRNTIDTMSDFACQGIRIQHPNQNVENFYNAWFKKINGKHVSERIVNMLYRAANVIIKRSYGHISFSDVSEWRTGKALEGYDDVELDKVQTRVRKIPLLYTQFNPLNVEVIGGELSTLTGKPILALRVTSGMKSLLNNRNLVNNEEVQRMIGRIPKDIRAMILAGNKLIPLPPDKTEVLYYKKDDWQVWAKPFVYPIMNNLMQLDKMNLADSSALDGAISNIRLWKLGVLTDNPATCILPKRALIDKLRNILANNVGGGVLDLVWGPELDFKESNSQVYKFLGPEKYGHTMNCIYEGMGIPPTMRSNSGSSTTGNYVGLNTMVKRLQYGRDKLIEFWDKELKIIHEAMGFPGRPPVVVFDFVAFTDEAAEKQLLINLWDRDVIPTETLQELFGRNPAIEKSRLEKESKERGEKMPEKASPFHNPDKEHEFRKILIQSGQVTPSEIGVELEERKEGEVTLLDKQEKLQLEMKKMQSTNKTGVSGRPKNVTETKKRKPKPKEKGQRSKAEVSNLIVWTNAAQQQIADIANRALLEGVGKANMRQLTNEEFEQIERIKFGILCNIEPFIDVDKFKIYAVMTTNYKPSDKQLKVFDELNRNFETKNERKPNADELRNLYALAYVFGLF